jgi:predicted esterase
MKLLTTIFLIALFSGNTHGQQRYLFYLHGAILENQGANAVSPEYGAYEYENILTTFRKEKFTVISEVRAKNTDVTTYAKKVVGQIDSLLKTGAPAKNITVIGASKGGMMTLYVSSFLKNKDVNFVILAGCFSDIANSTPQINLCGNILSIHEKSDDIGRSCTELKNHSPQAIPHYKEIELNTGLKHGFLYKPLPEWVSPSVKWARNSYE